MSGGDLYYRSVRILSAAFVVLGVLLVVRTVQHGGGPLSIGVLMGVLLIVLGVARMRIAARGPHSD